MSAERQAAEQFGPYTGAIAVVAMTTSSGATDLSAAFSMPGNADRVLRSPKGRMVRIVSTVAFYYRWSDATGTADETATTGANRVYYLAAGVERVERAMGDWFIHKGGSAGNVRISIASNQ